MLAKIKPWCLLASTLGPLGQWKGGSYYAIACAVPLAYLFNLLSWFSLGFFLFFYVLLITCVVIVLYCALKEDHERELNTLVLSPAFFFTVVFLGIAITSKIILFGYLWYLLIRVTFPLWIEETFSIRIKDFPRLLVLLVSDIGAAIIVNIIVRLSLWIGH